MSPVVQKEDDADLKQNILPSSSDSSPEHIDKDDKD